MSDGRTAYQDLLTLWKDADPDIPVLEQARAEFAELQLLQIFSSHPDDPRKRLPVPWMRDTLTLETSTAYGIEIPSAEA